MLRHLKKQYGFTTFRPYQKDIITDIIDKTDTIVVLPTGGGKSICYQFPATYLKKISIVVSPLLSLMNDQQMRLESSGIKSMCLNGTTYDKQPVSLLRRGPARKPSIVKKMESMSVIYCTPEFLTGHIDLFKHIEESICMFAIDEAHCLSEWGHDFRTSYMSLSMIRETFPDITIAAFTATATPIVLEDIFNTLNLEEATQYFLGTKRENLSIFVREKGADVITDLDINPDESCIIYVQTRKQTESIHKLLRRHGIRSVKYHAGMNMDDREESHDLFLKDDVKVMIATVCFGMGIDKPDVRKIINYGAPMCLETYYQEIGRAGRDGIDSKTVLLYGDGDFSTNSFLISRCENQGHRLKLMGIFRKYINNDTLCRQSMIECYFENGDIINDLCTTQCGKCDNCCDDDKSERQDVTEIATDMVNLVESLLFNVGTTKLVNIIRGSKAKSVSSFRDNRYYGCGAMYSVSQVKAVLEKLISEDVLVRKLCKKFTVIDVGSRKVENVLIKFADKKIKKSKEYDIRKRIADTEDIAPYMVVSDVVLDKISQYKPKTMNALLKIEGVTEDFAEKYGNVFIGAKTSSAKKTNTVQESYELYKAGNDIKEIANIRNLKTMTIEKHIVSVFKTDASLIDKGRIGLTSQVEAKIKDAVYQVGIDRLRPIKDLVGNSISYFQIQVWLALNN